MGELIEFPERPETEIWSCSYGGDKFHALTDGMVVCVDCDATATNLLVSEIPPILRRS